MTHNLELSETLKQLNIWYTLMENVDNIYEQMGSLNRNMKTTKKELNGNSETRIILWT